MEQILLHLWGDYILQTNRMATEKVHSWLWALIHGTVYSLPFLLIGSPLAVLIIWGTHCPIDRYSLAKRLKSFSDTTPESIRIWIPIIVDNTIHLTINFFALKYL